CVGRKTSHYYVLRPTIIVPEKLPACKYWLFIHAVPVRPDAQKKPPAIHGRIQETPSYSTVRVTTDIGGSSASNPPSFSLAPPNGPGFTRSGSSNVLWLFMAEEASTAPEIRLPLNPSTSASR